MKPLHRLGVTIACLLALAACSAAPDAADGQLKRAQRKEFNAQDKRVARALSIGGGEVREKSSPRFYATLCSLALAAIGERMQNSAILSVEQRQAFDQAQALYARRAVDGATRDEREHINRDIEVLYPEAADRARFAIGCLRDLAEGRPDVSNATSPGPNAGAPR